MEKGCGWDKRSCGRQQPAYKSSLRGLVFFFGCLPQCLSAPLHRTFPPHLPPSERSPLCLCQRLERLASSLVSFFLRQAAQPSEDRCPRSSGLMRTGHPRIPCGGQARAPALLPSKCLSVVPSDPGPAPGTSPSCHSHRGHPLKCPNRRRLSQGRRQPGPPLGVGDSVCTWTFRVPLPFCRAPCLLCGCVWKFPSAQRERLKGLGSLFRDDYAAEVQGRACV